MSRDAYLDKWLACLDQASQIVLSYRAGCPSGCDPQNSGIAIAIGAAALIGAGASAYGAQSSADAAEKAQKTNLDIANATNALNYQMFLQSRGSQGNALLPMYFGPQGTEQNLANQAYATWLAEQAALGSPTDQIAANRAITGAMAPSMAAGDALVNQLFSGELANQQVANIQPVLQARAGVAAAQKTGILEGLQARLNALSADRARAGYQGGGSAFQKNLLTGATIPAMQAAATVGAQTDVANAADVAAIKNQDIATRLQNLNLPLSRAANRIQFQNLPATAAGNTFTQSLQPFDWFKLNPSAFQAQRPPLVSPVPGIGSIVGAGVGAGASTLGNYFAMRSLANQMAPQSQPFTIEQYMQQQQMMNEMGQIPASAQDISTGAAGPDFGF